MKKQFQQSINESQISFENVVRLYGNKPLYIVQVYNNEWINVKMEATEYNIWYYAMGGATKFQFEVVNQFDTVCFPDYSLSELLK